MVKCPADSPQTSSLPQLLTDNGLRSAPATLRDRQWLHTQPPQGSEAEQDCGTMLPALSAAGSG